MFVSINIVAIVFPRSPSPAPHPQAGEYYAMCGEFARAVKLCLAAGDDAGIAGAIAVVKRCAGRPEREPLVRLLHDHLTGDVDGKAKDPNHGTVLWPPNLFALAHINPHCINRTHQPAYPLHIFSVPGLSSSPQSSACTWPSATTRAPPSPPC